MLSYLTIIVILHRLCRLLCYKGLTNLFYTGSPLPLRLSDFCRRSVPLLSLGLSLLKLKRAKTAAAASSLNWKQLVLPSQLLSALPSWVVGLGRSVAPRINFYSLLVLMRLSLRSHSRSVDRRLERPLGPPYMKSTTFFDPIPFRLQNVCTVCI